MDKHLVFHQAFQGYNTCVSTALTVCYNIYLSVQQKLNETNIEKLPQGEPHQTPVTDISSYCLDTHHAINSKELEPADPSV